MFSPYIHKRKDDLRKALQARGIIVLKNAFSRDLVERLTNELNGSTEWEHEKIEQVEGADKKIKYSRDYIKMGSGKEPAALLELKEFLDSEDCRNLISYISCLACKWFEGSAALLGPNDIIDVHNDKLKIARTIGFNLYLNKDWKASYGGEFVFLNPYTEVRPEFNTLSLFLVNDKSYHKVNPVCEEAARKRLAISGWFHWM